MGKESSIICSRLNKEYNYLMNFEMHDNIKNNILCKIQFLLKIILTNIIFNFFIFENQEILKIK